MTQYLVNEVELRLQIDLLHQQVQTLEAMAGLSAPLELAAVERLHIEKVLKLAEGNRSKAARLLGISRSTLTRKGF